MSRQTQQPPTRQSYQLKVHVAVAMLAAMQDSSSSFQDRRERPRGGVVVELVGLPASGKSTLADRLVATVPGLRSARQGPGNPFARVRSKLVSAYRGRAAITEGALGLISDSRPSLERVRSLRWLLTTLENYEQLDGPIVLAEGALQRAVLLFYDAQRGLWDDGRVRRYVERAPRSDLVVHLEVAPEIAASRYRERLQQIGEKTRLDHSSIPLERHMVSIDSVIRLALCCLPKQEGRILTVRPDHDSLDIVRNAIEGLEPM